VELATADVVTILRVRALGGSDEFSSVVVLLGVAAMALSPSWDPGRRLWLQSIFAACTLSFLVVAPGPWPERRRPPRVREDLSRLMLLTHSLTAILVLGDPRRSPPRRRAVTFLLLVPDPAPRYLRPLKVGPWHRYEGPPRRLPRPLSRIALGETIFAATCESDVRDARVLVERGVIALIVAGPIYTYELESLDDALRGRETWRPPRPRVLSPGSPCRRIRSRSRRAVRRAEPRRRDSGARRSCSTNDVRIRLRTAEEEASDRPTLIVPATRESQTPIASASFVPIDIPWDVTPCRVPRIRPGGFVVLENLADLSVLSGWRAAGEGAVRFAMCTDSRSTVIWPFGSRSRSERP